MARPAVIPITPDLALDDTRLSYRRGVMPGAVPGTPGGAVVNYVEATLPIPDLNTTEVVARRVADIPLSVFTGVSDTNAKQLHMKQVRAVLEWLRTEAGLQP